MKNSQRFLIVLLIFTTVLLLSCKTLATDNTKEEYIKGVDESLYNTMWLSQNEGTKILVLFDNNGHCYFGEVHEDGMLSVFDSPYDIDQLLGRKQAFTYPEESTCYHDSVWNIGPQNIVFTSFSRPTKENSKYSLISENLTLEFSLEFTKKGDNQLLLNSLLRINNEETPAMASYDFGLYYFVTYKDIELTKIETLENFTFGSYSFEDGVKEIGEFLGERADIKQIVLPNSLEVLGEYALWPFFNLTSLNLPNSLRTIKKHSIVYLRFIDSLFIPASVTTIEPSAIIFCANLSNIEVAKDNPNYCSIDGALYSKNGTVLILYPEAKGSIIDIKEGTKTLEDNCCSGNTTVKKVIIPSSVTKMGSSLFLFCPYLSEIQFNGTVSQWEAIEKDDLWNLGVNINQVKCLDGTVTL